MATEDARKLFVAGLPDSITEEVLRQLFEAAGGTVVNVSLPKDRATGRPRGFGFVTLSSPEEAERTRGSLDGTLQAGRSISVRPFSSEPPRRGETRSEAPAAPPASSEDRTVYVGNLPYDATQQELEQLFTEKEVRSVVRIHLPAGPDGRPRGFGFVTFGNSEAANEAIVALRNSDVRGRRLMINIAHPRGERGSTGGGDRGPMPDRIERRPRSPMGDARGPSGPPDFAMEPVPDFGESARPLEGRRARAEKVVDRGATAERPGDAKKKKKKKGRSAADDKQRRGGGNSWQNWDELDDE
jgi:RNA recognition motif-containing protein